MRRRSPLSLADIVRLQNEIREASGTHVGWDHVVTEIGRCLQTPANVLTVEDHGLHTSTITLSPTTNPEFTDSYNSYFHSVNILIQRARQMLRPGEILMSSGLCSDRDLERSEFYNGWLKPQGLFYVIGGQIGFSNESSLVLNCIRDKSAGDFTQEEIDFLVCLGPCFQQAAQHRRIASILLQGHQAFESAGYGFISFTAAGNVADLNRYAQQMINSRDGLDAWIRKLRGGLPPSGHIVIQRPSGKKAYLLVALRQNSNSMKVVGPDAALVVLVKDPEQNLVPVSAIWYSYGLTRAEIRLANQLTSGVSLDQACESLCIARNTGRAHLRAIYHKTGVQRQTQLVRLALAYAVPSEIDSRSS